MKVQNFWIKQDPTARKGDLLFTSKAQLQGNPKIYEAQVFDNLMLFDDMCIKYSFDLKFAIKESQMKLEYFDHTMKTMIFELPLNDDSVWTAILRKKLNQKGFHQAFKPLKKIGKGSFATVFLVQKIETKEHFAVKAFSKESAYGQEKGKECLIKEIEILRSLNHPNIMKLEQVFESDNSLYMVFEYLKGGQLLKKTEDSYQFKYSDIQVIIKCLLLGLEHMHKQSIMHRDLKPENILFKSQNEAECCIADFGLAQFSDLEEYLFTRCGTPGFVAPQVINIKDMNTKYDPICDIFSLGLIFHILLMGQPLFKERKNDALVKENKLCQFDFSGSVYKNKSYEAIDLLKKMLRINPQQRINAQQALNHPFFKENIDNEKEDKVLSEKKENILKKKEVIENKNTPINDSCIAFKLGKQNVITGNTETLNEFSNNQVSAFDKQLVSGKASKFSKFAKPN